MYNASHGEAFVSLGEYQSSGGLAQLGEHYVRNVGVGGSTPLPSTRLILTRQQPQESRIITRHFRRQIPPHAVGTRMEYDLFPEQFPQQTVQELDY